MLYNNSYKTFKPVKTLMSRLFGWTRAYFHFCLFKDTFLWLHRHYTDEHYNAQDLVFRGCSNALELVERIGGQVTVEGLEHLREYDGPVVLVGNHMSTLETVLLPAVIIPSKPISFILKKSLLEVPYYSSSVRLLDSVGVSRDNPVNDFKVMMKEGGAHLKNGTSVVVFPQTTRTLNFDPEQFGTAGVKLAKRSGVPVLPFAVKTDFMQNGKVIKDFGPIYRKRPVHIEFGPVMEIDGNEKEVHQQTIDFISGCLARWKAEDGC